MSFEEDCFEDCQDYDRPGTEDDNGCDDCGATDYRNCTCDREEDEDE